MAVSAARDNILSRIRQALSNPVPLPFPLSEGNQPLYPQPAEALEIIFAEIFTSLQGKFAFCLDEHDLAAQVFRLLQTNGWSKVYCNEARWQPAFSTGADLATCDVSITGCEYLVARTGSIVLSASLQNGRTASVYAPVHICIAYTSQLVYDLGDALQQFKDLPAGELPSLISFASGPSRTADIEKTLVTGVHGPKEVYLFLIDGIRPDKHLPA